MRRDYLLPAGLAALLVALLLATSWGLLAAPSLPADLLPSEALVVRVEPLGNGRQRVTARLAPRQSVHDLYTHLVSKGWSMRRVNIMPEDEDQVYLRRSMAGYMLETVIVTRASRDRGLLTVTYARCVRRVNCGWR